MTPQEWHNHQNLRKWLHTQQQLVKDQKMFKSFRGYRTIMPFDEWPGLDQDARNYYKNHVKGLMEDVQSQRGSLRGKAVVPMTRKERADFRCFPEMGMAVWQARSEKCFRQVCEKLKYTCSPDMKFSTYSDLFAFEVIGSSRGRRGSSYSNVIAHISAAYFKCVGHDIYKRIGTQLDFLILHASRVGKYQDADAFKVRVVRLSGKKTDPDVKITDQYLLIGEGNAFGLGDTLMAAKRTLHRSVTEKVTTRLATAL